MTFGDRKIFLVEWLLEVSRDNFSINWLESGSNSKNRPVLGIFWAVDSFCKKIIGLLAPHTHLFILIAIQYIKKKVALQSRYPLGPPLPLGESDHRSKGNWKIVKRLKFPLERISLPTIWRALPRVRAPGGTAEWISKLPKVYEPC